LTAISTLNTQQRPHDSKSNGNQIEVKSIYLLIYNQSIQEIQDHTFFTATASPQTLPDPAQYQKGVLNDNERWSKTRFLVVLGHQEVHSKFPDFDGVGLNFLEHVAAQFTQIH